MCVKALFGVAQQELGNFPLLLSFPEVEMQ
jgi:hypothetical protein